MADEIGGLSFLPLPDRQPDGDGFFTQVLTGWKRSQVAQNFTEGTIRRRLRTVQRFADFTGRYPWEWTPSDVDDYFAHLRGVRNVALSTARAYQSDIALFCAYATSESYEWNDACIRTFGTGTAQVVTDLNRARHTQEADMGPEKRAFDLGELQDCTSGLSGR
ncbi:phage integrase N-terminal SAM-like domain-containing protein [Curtobacterium sp. MCBD17_003]|uniref:phage integrase N-terminal SAM-like domain-containing protein n=1 Tax=Curtobacterium sp. MCBD17_003 TaxID=2175667 RepID=UPI000DAACDAF|nr:phage integrase N-terminal SAM-like domain-containing protein [Curtobacterium sp. MCBD17_003]WIE53189.1 phage integrase N-terminal SAM-like domain-containing protein [Curtobacterium sp. MCBD17_003]